MICTKCGTEFNSNFCPSCGTPVQSQMQQNQSQQVPPVMPQQQYQQQPPKKKKHGCLTAILIVIGVIVLIGVINAIANPSSNTSTDVSTSNNATTDSSNSGKSEEAKPTEKPIEYTAYDVSEMMNDLDSNALKAEKKYQDQYIEITGRLSNIDSDGKYIGLVPSDDEYAFMGVQCYIKSDEQTEKVMEMAIGDTVTIKGKITSIGEILGYALDIDEID